MDAVDDIDELLDAPCPACGSRGPHKVFRFERITVPDVFRAACRDCPVGFELEPDQTPYAWTPYAPRP